MESVPENSDKKMRRSTEKLPHVNCRGWQHCATRNRRPLVSTRKRVIVSRSYQPKLDAMAQALELLPKTPVNQKGGPTTALENAERNLSEIRVERIIPPQP